MKLLIMVLFATLGRPRKVRVFQYRGGGVSLWVAWGGVGRGRGGGGGAVLRGGGGGGGGASLD